MLADCSAAVLRGGVKRGPMVRRKNHLRLGENLIFLVRAGV
jgi:hypothetical protein